MRDTRIFRVTRLGGRQELCNRIGAGGRAGGNGAMGATIARIEAANEQATSGWADVTTELMPWRAASGKGE